MAISSAGLGSGLDVNSIITGLMQVERQPLVNIQTQKTNYQSKISAYGTLKSALTTFQTSASALSSASKFNAQKATPTDATVFTATTNGSASLSNFDISVSQLAKSQKLASTGFTNVSDTVGTGTLTISFGTYTAADSDPLTTNDNTFAANADKTDITLTIDSSNNTLAGIRDAINAKNASVSATIVNDGTTNRLVITSKDTGEVNSLKISVADDDGDNIDSSSGLSRLAYDPTATTTTGKNMLQMQAAKDAKLNIDGIDIQKSSNTISDAIDGVTLKLLKTTDTGVTVGLNIETNEEEIKKSVQEFVDAYNKLNTTMKDLGKFNETDKTKNGKLIGDSTLRTISTQIRSVMTSSIGSNTINTLSDVGISFQNDGTLSLDADTLSDAIDNNFSGIAKLFSASATFTDAQMSFVGSTANTKEGTYAINVTSIGSSTANFVGTINGVGATGSSTGLTGAPNDDSEGLSIKVEGSTTGSRGTVTFTKGFAALLDGIIENFLDEDDGLLATKTDGINDSLELLDDKTERLNQRLVTIEARYRAQYSRLDTLLSSMSNTSSYLSQQIASINANS